jgi:hypothetical protein
MAYRLIVSNFQKNRIYEAATIDARLIRAPQITKMDPRNKLNPGTTPRYKQLIKVESNGVK